MTVFHQHPKSAVYASSANFSVVMALT
jgi:hypothetical protein